MKLAFKILLLVFLAANYMHATETLDSKKSGLSKTNTIGLIERFDINQVDMALDNQGNTGKDDTFFPKGATTKFLWAGGIGATGYVDGELRASWTIEASRIQEYQPGKWGMNPDDAMAKFYKVRNGADGFGSEAYVEWANAVALGADFQDLDGDGQYDPNIDKPDMIGDMILWNVFNDGTGSTSRDAGLLAEPMGLEIHQQLWGFDRGDALGDVIFVRYRLINQSDDDIDDFIFSAVMDPDLGDAQDDLIGCDTTLSLGYIYNDAEDTEYGPNAPAFGLDFFQGPIVESIGDTAFKYRGPFFGIDTLVDMKNLPMTSFMYYIQSHQTLGDPDNAQEGRWYQEGGVDGQGNAIDPPNFGFGTGADASTDPRYLFSGDPVAGTGWLDDPPDDKRFLVNSGPFQLAAHDTQDVVIAYIVSQGSDPINSVTKLKEEDIIAQTAYDANFFVAGPPPPVEFSGIRAFDNKIDFIVDMKVWLDYDVTDKLFNRQVFEGFTVYQFQSPNPSDIVNNSENAKAIATFDLNNQYGDIYEDKGGERFKVWKGQNNLNLEDFEDKNSQYFHYSIETDAFNSDEPLTNYKMYYYGIVPFSIDVNHIILNTNTSVDNDYYFPLPGGFLQPSRQSGLFSLRPGAESFDPFKDISSLQENITQIAGKSEGYVSVSVVDPELITGHDYQVDFVDDGNLWSITDNNLDVILADSVSSQAFSGESWSFPIVDGMSVQVFNVIDSIKSVTVTGTPWLKSGALEGAFGDSAVFNDGINYTKFFKPEFSSTKHDQYFPVKIVFGMTKTDKAYWFNGINPTLTRYGGLIDTSYISAYDMSDADNPRRLNIVYNAFRKPDLIFTQESKSVIYVTHSSYDPSGDAYPDSTGKMGDSYLALELALNDLNDTTLYDIQAGIMELIIEPTFVNSNADKFSFSSASLVTTATTAERKDVLEKVKVVPNPYFAYSSYETSYDTPVIKFTNMDSRATIRIFTVSGQLVTTIEKDDLTNEVTWDLRNDASLKVSSGIYIAHIKVPGVGEKVLKFGIIQREERIDRF